MAETRCGVYPTCPYCGHEMRDDYATLLDFDTVECEECGKHYESERTMEYVCRPLDGEDDGNG